MSNTEELPSTATLLRGRGVMLEADIAGPATAPCVVLMHGGGQTRHAWRRVSRNLIDAGYRVVAYDSRGHGGSEWSPDGIYNIDIFADDLRAILEQLPSRPALVGASMGGVTALLTAAQDPKLAAALVLVDVTPVINLEGAERITGFMRQNLDGFSSLEHAADSVAAYLPHRPRPRDNSGLMKNLRKGADGRLYWHWDPKIFNDGTAKQRTAVVEQLIESCKRVENPTLLIRGSNSEIVTPEGARHFQSLIPGSEWVDVAGARHMVAGDNNDAFSAAILEFLTRVMPPSKL
jgi:pimeloyl-ACP methyl ester carboxylesterase